MWRVALGACGVTLALLVAVTWQLREIERLEHELGAAKAAVATYERIRDADVSRGDAADDDSWLCARSGLRGCRP